jgi:hypothetical protein
MPVALGQTQLPAPGDVTHDFGLTFSAHLQDSAHPGREAVIPRPPPPARAGRGCCPVLVIAPWRRLEPLEYYEGTNPRKPISSRGRAKR